MIHPLLAWTSNKIRPAFIVENPEEQNKGREELKNLMSQYVAKLYDD